MTSISKVVSKKMTTKPFFEKVFLKIDYFNNIDIIPSKRTRSLHQVNILEEIIEEDRTTFDFFTNFILILLVLLVLVIGTLYYKLWTIEDLGSIRSFPDINVIE